MIDPLVYSTLFGGNSDPEYAWDVAVDSNGYACAAGHTNSADFPTTPGAWDTDAQSGVDALVTKINADGTGLIFSTFLGGVGSDYAYGVDVDQWDNCYAVGRTNGDFPTTAGAFQEVYAGGYDAFVTRVNATGATLDYSTYLGGDAGYEYAQDVDVMADGVAAVVGYTTSTNYNTTVVTFEGAYRGGVQDGFLAKFLADGSDLVYSGYVGGNQTDEVLGVVMDVDGIAYLTGSTNSTDFPATGGAYDTAFNGGPLDAFVAAVDALGSSYMAVTYLGSNDSGASTGRDWGREIDLGAGNQPVVVGRTYSMEFPTTAGVYQEVYGGGNWDSFITRLTAALDGLVWSTYLGSTGGDDMYDVVLDSADNVFVAGGTGSINLETTAGSIPPNSTGVGDGYSAKFNPTASTLLYGTYIAGGHVDSPQGIDVDAAGYVYIVGYTQSADFPTTSGAYDETLNGTAGDADPFALKLDVSAPNTTVSFDVDATPRTLVIEVNGTGFWTPFTYWCEENTPLTLHAPSPQALNQVRYPWASWSDGGNQTHDITCGEYASYEATFDTEWEVTLNTAPVDLSVSVDNVTVAAPNTTWWPENEAHWIAVSPAVYPSAWTRWVFANWSDGGAIEHSAVATVQSGALNLTANFTAESLVTIDTYPSGHNVTVDGANYTTPAQFWWDNATAHNVSALPSIDVGGGEVKNFTGWTNGGAITHDITASGPLNLTANYTSSFLVSVDTSPTGLTYSVDDVSHSAPMAFWWEEGSQHWLNASGPQGNATTRWQFDHWWGGPGSTNGSHQVTATGPLTFYANFTAEHNVTVDTEPTGFNVTVDSVNNTAPTSFWWAQDSQHDLEAPTSQGGLFFNNWTDGEPLAARTIAVTGPATYVANYTAAPPALNASVSANVTSGNAPLDVQFFGFVVGGFPPLSFNWSFGEGNYSDLQNPQHLFVVAGNYTVTFTVTDSQMDSANDTINITVTPPPPPLELEYCTIDPTNEVVQIGNSVQFAAKGWDGPTELSGVGVTWSVTGGIGTVNATGLFNATTVGTGNVTANVTYGGDFRLCPAQVTVTLGAPPTVAILTPLTAAAIPANNVTVTGTAANADRVEVGLSGSSWQDATGNTTWSTVLDISSLPPGNLDIHARSWNGTVESTHAVRTVQKVERLDSCTLAPPSAAVQVGGWVQFTATGYNGSNVISAVPAESWSVSGPGTVNATGLYNATTVGNATVFVNLTAFGVTAGCQAEVTVTLLPPPTVTITSPAENAVVTTGNVTVTGNSTDAEYVQVAVGAAGWQNASGLDPWTFDRDISPYPDGPLQIQARAFGSGVWSTPDSVTIDKRTPPTVNITAPAENATFPGPEVPVSGTATDATLVEVSIGGTNWAAAAGTSSWTAVLNISSLSDGAIEIHARAWNGAVESGHATVTVYKESPNLPPTATLAVTPGTGPAATVFAFNGSLSDDPDGNITSYDWEFGDGTTGSGAVVSHVFPKRGVYAVNLTVEDDGGLTATATVSVTVANTPPTITTANPAGNSASVEADDELKLSVVATDIDVDDLVYSWTVNGVAVGTVFNFTFSNETLGDYTVTVTVGDGQATVTRSWTITVTAPSPPQTGGGLPAAAIGLLIAAIVAILLILLLLLRRRKKPTEEPAETEEAPQEKQPAKKPSEETASEEETAEKSEGEAKGETESKAEDTAESNLESLEKARDAGLLTAEEYEQKRQELLDQL